MIIALDLMPGASLTVRAAVAGVFILVMIGAAGAVTLVSALRRRRGLEAGYDVTVKARSKAARSKKSPTARQPRGSAAGRPEGAVQVPAVAREDEVFVVAAPRLAVAEPDSDDGSEDVNASYTPSLGAEPPAVDTSPSSSSPFASDRDKGSDW